MHPQDSPRQSLRGRDAVTNGPSGGGVKAQPLARKWATAARRACLRGERIDECIGVYWLPAVLLEAVALRLLDGHYQQ